MNRIRYGMFVMALLLALVLSAFNVAPAFADESTPPPAETVSQETATSKEVAEEAESTPPEEEATTPLADEETDSAVESESPSVAEVIESLPEETTLVVVDEDGEALPLASEEAAEIIKVADPQWCPVGVTPGAATCSGEFPKFNGAGGLIEWLVAHQPNKAGVIWIAWDYVGTVGVETGAVILDGGDYGTMGNFALTINGGWVSGKTLNPNTPSTFNVPFIITDWTGAITINNIVVNGTNLNDANLGVQTAGNVTFNNVDVQNNTTGYGAFITNTVGTVTVNDSTFNNNTGSDSDGLRIYSNNTVTLKNVTAMGNFLYGVYINNSGATTPKAVILNGTNHFSYNSSDGLVVYTKGAITLNNVTAIGNTGGSGAYLDNCNYHYGTSACDFGVATTVTVKGVNNFSENGWDGLRVWSGGVITVSNITANDNGTSVTRPGGSSSPDNFNAYGKGVLLFNYGSVTPKNIVISGTNTFNNNASAGIYADAWGKITVNNLTANNNGCNLTFEIDDFYCAGAFFYVGGGFTQTGYGKFEGNSGDGLHLQAYNKGVLVFNNLYADNNDSAGVAIEGFGASPINVTLNGINTFTNNGSITGKPGLFINTDGIITVNNLTASFNFAEGAVILNAGSLTPKAVIIKGPAVFNQNDGAGLVIISKGAVTTAGLTALNNGENGVLIDNCLDSGGICAATTAQKVTLNGNNFMDSNGQVSTGIGLEIFSRGAITVNNLTSNYNLNGGAGAVLINKYDNATAGVILKGFVMTSFNEDSGLYIRSNGAVTLANLTANHNSYSGAYIENNADPAKPMNVTITGINQTSSNAEDGLFIFTYGAVVISNLTANYNEGATSSNYGLYVDNSSGGTLARPVTLLGTNMFNGNFGTGLGIYSLGAIKVNNVMANDNDAAGAWLMNDFDTLISQPVTITGYGIFNDNGSLSLSYGLVIESHGNVTLANITANDNGDYGVYIYAENEVKPASFANVTITGVNTFNGNALGLWVRNDGAITVSNITANGNDDYGARLDNLTLANSGEKGKAVTISGTNMFNGNENDGLYVDASGNVTLTRITANDNINAGLPQPHGVNVFSSLGNIAFTCGSLNNNEVRGYALHVAGSGKTITLKGVFTFGNGLIDLTSGATTITRGCPLP